MWLAVMKASERAVRVGADPEVEPCGAHAILRTRLYWLEYFGRREAAESKRQKQDIRMPETKIQEILEMPYLEVEVRFAEKMSSLRKEQKLLSSKVQRRFAQWILARLSAAEKIQGIPSAFGRGLQHASPMPTSIHWLLEPSQCSFPMEN